MFDGASFWLVSAILLLTIGLSIILFIWGRPDRFRSRSRLKAFLDDFGPLLACSALVVACGMLVLHAFTLRVADPSPIDRSLLPGFAASLLEDIFFFIAVGVVIFVVQRREFERGRPAADRIDTLFNAKKLSPTEMLDLQARVREISCDFRRCEVHIDIREHRDASKGIACVRLDVTRKWRVGSYLSDADAHYAWKLRIRPDDIAGVSPLLMIYPSITRPYRTDSDNMPIPSGSAKTLNPLTVQNTADEYIYPQPGHGTTAPFEPIQPGEIRVFTARYLVWQRVAGSAGAPEQWAFSIRHHWDAVWIQISNSLAHTATVRIRGAANEDHPLHPGEHTEIRAFKDVSRDARFLFEFDVAG